MKLSKHTVLSALKLIYDADRKSFLLEIIYNILGAVIPLANLYVLKVLVDMVSQSDTAAVWYVAAFAAVYFAGRLVNTLQGVCNDILIQKLIDYVSAKIHAKSVELDLAFYDNPEFFDTLHRAQQEASLRPVQILESSMAVMSSVISLAGVLAVIFSQSPLIVAVMAVAVLPSFFVRLLKARKMYAFRKERTPLERRSRYYSMVLTDERYAAELRAYSLGEKFRKLYTDTRKAIVEFVISISRKMALLDTVCAVVETGALAAITVMLVGDVIDGQTSIGSFVMLFEAFRRGMGYLQSTVKGLGGLYNNKLFVSNLFDFLAINPVITSPAQPVPFPEKVESVEFSHIAFTYPGSGNPVFTDYSLTASKGSITRIEGENGFGKTTLVKLLLRLYDPQGGAVLINGIDIRKFSLRDLRKGVSAVFQEFVRYYLTFAENISLGDVDAPRDEQKIERSIRLASLSDVVKSLPRGKETPLGRAFDGGVELSMGQRQRLAIARELYSDSQVLLFDEPLAWMDVNSRSEFMKTLSSMSEERVVILISHL